MVALRVSRSASTAKRIDHTQTGVVLLVAEVFGVHSVARHSACRSEDGGVPVRELKAPGDIHCLLKQLQRDWLDREPGDQRCEEVNRLSRA